MKKKAFTLVELLAVIVILGIILTIAIPSVSKTIKNSKKESIETTAKMLAKTAEDYYSYNLVNYNTVDKVDLTNDELDYRGDKPDLGFAYFDDKGRAYIKMYYNGYCVIRNYDGTIELDKTSPDSCTIENMVSVTLYLDGAEATYGSEWVKADNYISTILKEGESITNIPTVTKTGYTFLGWYNNNEEVDLNVVVNSNLVATAKFEANTYTVTINLQGGTVMGSYEATRKIKFGELYGSLPTPTKVGYTFTGYKTNNGNNGSPINSNSKLQIASNHTLYATWDPNKYMVSTSVSCGNSATLGGHEVTYGGTYGSFGTPTCAGYTFAGWATKDGTIINSTDKVTITSDIELYGQWTANAYTVTFVYNNGSTNTTKEVTYGSAYGDLPTPTKTGYTFNGWTTSSGVAVTSTSKVSVAGNHTLYAQYSTGTYLVTFEPMGGSLSQSTKYVIYNSTYGTLPTPTRAGYKFNGWYTNNGNNAALITSTSKVTITTNHTLYAKWTANTYTVSFSSAENVKNLYENGEVVYFNPVENKACTVNEYNNNSAKESFQGCLKWYAYLDSPSSSTVKLMLNQNAKEYDSLTDNAINLEAVIKELEAKNWNNAVLNTFNIISAEEIATIVGNTSFSLGDDIKNISSNSWLFDNIRDESVASELHWGYVTSTPYSGINGDMLYYIFLNNLYTADSGSMDFQITPIGIRPSIVVDKTLLANNIISTKTVSYNSTYGTLPTPTRTGYSFLGWYTTSGVKITSTTVVNTTSDITLYAQWKANTYTVTFEVPVGGTLNTTSITVTYGQPYGPLPTAKSSWADGTPFLGWFTDGAGLKDSNYVNTCGDYGCGYGTKIESTTIVDRAEDHTLYGAFSYWCFVKGTKVLTKDGLKNIEDIKVGEYVYTLDMEQNEVVLKKVNRTLSSYASVTYKMKIGTEIVEMTDKHQLYIKDKGWVRAYNAQIGDKLVDIDGKEVEILEIEKIVYENPIKTYNLTVEGNHNYFITNTRLLVHNAQSIF